MASAVKAFYRQEVYAKELECYQRLKRADVRHLVGFDIPILKGFDDSLMVIEISIVEPPYLLDFGKVYLDSPPSYVYDSQMMQNAYAEWRERFGKGWEDVAIVLDVLAKKFGIYYVDPRRSNIDTGDDDDDDFDMSVYEEEDPDP